MDIEHKFNFNDPVEVTAIFRIPGEAGGKPREYGGKLSFGWEDIKVIEENVYADDWENYKGDKFWIQLHNDPSGKLVLGNYHDMTRFWKQFRNRFPLFQERDEED